jgi:biopolymer transport protein ExbB
MEKAMMNNSMIQGGWEEVSKTYYTQFFVAGGPIVWFILLPMSLMALYFIVELSLATRRKRLLAATVSAEMLTAALHHGAENLPNRFSKRSDMVSRAVCAAYEKTAKMQTSVSLLTQIAAENLQEQAMRLLRRAEWCSLLGAVAPMVGLFGTVWGMIEAFNLLGVSAGQPKPAQLASSISVALVTTFWGLLVGIPSLFMYGLFRMRIESLVTEAAVEVETLLRRLADIKSGNSIRPEIKPGVPRPQPLPQTEVKKAPVPQEKNIPPAAAKTGTVAAGDSKSAPKPILQAEK